LSDAATNPGSSATLPSSAAEVPGPQPEPARGVFETLLVLDGRPVELDAHLARLGASVRALYGRPAPAVARDLIVDGARGSGLARLRLGVAPEGGELQAGVRIAAVDESLLFPDWERGLELAPVVVAGGIGPHKWADRRLLEHADAGVAPRLALILDRDGTVLEASRGSVFAVLDGVLVTPAADGRILPGVTRGRVLALAAALGLPCREEILSFERLRSADEVFLTGAVRGIEPVRGCDGAPGWAAGPVTAGLSRELRDTWIRAAGPGHVPSRGVTAHARVD
jgi:para-aminobenzoate synthetase / 4-amino-4-deoxychorismate lyase